MTVLGAQMHPLTPALGRRIGRGAGEGIFIAAVAPRSPLTGAEIAPGDVLIKVDGRRVSTPAQVQAMLGACKPGETVRLSVLREGRRRDRTMALQEGANAPSPASAAGTILPAAGMTPPAAGTTPKEFT